MLYDSSRCTACRGCQTACKQWWELPAVSTTNRGSYENPPELGPETWNKIRFRETAKLNSVRWLFTRQACMHCSTAVCVWVCPTYARSYGPDGHVDIDRERCIGCGRCGQYCPFEVPKLGVHDVTPRINVELYTPRKVSYKCTWCQDRLESGIMPACVKTCPTGVLQFGERSDILLEANKRLTEVKKTHPEANLYGENELGGLHAIYLLTEEPYVHGLPENPQIGQYPAFDVESFPDWYIKALNEDLFPLFPSNARREWYMEPDLEPTSALRGAPLARGKSFLSEHNMLAWGWLGVGVVAASAAMMLIHRRRNENKTDAENKPGARTPDRNPDFVDNDENKR